MLRKKWKNGVFPQVYSTCTLKRSMSSAISRVDFRNSRVARSTSLDCVMYRPTMIMSAPLASASGAVSGVTPPATATSIFCPGNVCLMSLIISHLVLPVFSASMARCRIATSGSFLSVLSLATGSSTFIRSITA